MAQTKVWETPCDNNLKELRAALVADHTAQHTGHGVEVTGVAAVAALGWNCVLCKAVQTDRVRILNERAKLNTRYDEKFP